MEILIFCQWLVGTVFLVSTLAKVRKRTAWSEFVESVRRLAFSSRETPIAVLVVTAEAATAGLVIIPRTLLAGFGLAIGLLTAFSIAIGRVVRSGAVEQCRCFGASRMPVGRRHIVRNVIISGMALLGGVARLTTANGNVPPGGWVVAAAAGSVAGIVLIVADEIVELFTVRSTGRTEV